MAKAKSAAFLLFANRCANGCSASPPTPRNFSADLDTIDWTDSLKEMQRNWIGRSEGAEVEFQIADSRIADLRIQRLIACSRRVPTLCLARLTWCCRRNISSLTRSQRRNSAKRLRNTKPKFPKSPILNARNWRRKRPAFHRRLRHQSGQRRENSHLDCRLRSRQLWHRRHHGRAGA